MSLVKVHPLAIYAFDIKRPTRSSSSLPLRATRMTLSTGEDALIPDMPFLLTRPRSKPYRIYIALLVCLAMFFCNFLAAGPTMAIVDITVDFFGTPPTNPAFVTSISKIAYFFTSTALLQGVGNLFWMPLILKYGRRPIYIVSFAAYTACAIWSGVSTSFASELASRVLMGFFSGSGECMAPLTISDIFFLHERGFYMAWVASSSVHPSLLLT